MKRVLIVTYYWPPSGGSGVQRWLKFAKYLPALGWAPVVVAPAGADYPVVDESLLADVAEGTEVLRFPIREPYAAYRRLTGAPAGDVRAAPAGGGGQRPGLMRRFAGWIRANFFVPDPRVWWVRPTSRRVIAYLRERPVDAIVTTGPPHSVHLIGRHVKRAFPTLPWIVDVRDPWSRFDVHLAFGPGRRARRRNAELERACLAECDLVLGTSPSMPTHLEPFDARKYVAITNGYDAADFPAAPTVPRPPVETGRFHLYHTGLLGANRNPTALWAALAALAREDAGFGESLHVHLIGNVDAAVVESLAAHLPLAGRWTVTPWLAHDALVARYADADAFLLCPNRSDNARGQINGKLFEYLAARRPILHVGPFDADNTRLLDETHAGLTVPPGDEDAARQAVEALYSGRFSANPHALPADAAAPYERRATAARLAAVLDRLPSTPNAKPVPTPV